MAYQMEIECKCRVNARIEIALRDRLIRESQQFWRVRKDDVYYDVPCITEERASSVLLRLRKEYYRREWRSVLTYKSKQRGKEGIETNVERECLVSDGEVIRSIFHVVGAQIHAIKRKRGWGFLYRWRTKHEETRFTIELVEVQSLGLFIELETLLNENSTQEEREKKRRQLLDVMRNFGLEKESVEERYYIDMIRNI